MYSMREFEAERAYAHEEVVIPLGVAEIDDLRRGRLQEQIEAVHSQYPALEQRRTKVSQAEGPYCALL